MTPVHTLHQMSVRSILILSSHLHLAIPFMFPNYNFVRIFHLTHACYMTHTLRHFITLIVCGEAYKL
jgi:hypothetical protein